MEEREDPREHIDDTEWLYQHGYFDKTLYGVSRRFHDALRHLFRPLIDWIERHAYRS